METANLGSLFHCLMGLIGNSFSWHPLWISLVSTYVLTLLVLSFTLWRGWLHHLANLPRGTQGRTDVKCFQSHPFSTLNLPKSLSLSSQDECFSPRSGDLHFSLLLLWRAKPWMWYSGYDLTSPEYREIIISLDLLAMLLLVQSWTLLGPLCWQHTCPCYLPSRQLVVY